MFKDAWGEQGWSKRGVWSHASSWACGVCRAHVGRAFFPSQIYWSVSCLNASWALGVLRNVVVKERVHSSWKWFVRAWNWILIVVVLGVWSTAYFWHCDLWVHHGKNLFLGFFCPRSSSHSRPPGRAVPPTLRLLPSKNTFVCLLRSSMDLSTATWPAAWSASFKGTIHSIFALEKAFSVNYSLKVWLAKALSCLSLA